MNICSDVRKVFVEATANIPTDFMKSDMGMSGKEKMKQGKEFLMGSSLRANGMFTVKGYPRSYQYLSKDFMYTKSQLQHFFLILFVSRWMPKLKKARKIFSLKKEKIVSKKLCLYLCVGEYQGRNLRKSQFKKFLMLCNFSGRSTYDKV